MPTDSLTIAVTQMSCSWDLDANIARAEALVREAADKGAGLVLLQELFATPYFCAEQNPQHFVHAQTFSDNTLLQHFAALAQQTGVVLPISYFEQTERQYFNSVAIIDADGQILGNYRKTHIPDGPGYQEKFYFTPGDTGYCVWDTQAGRIGVGICWDQWFPEAARSMALQGADILLYPTAIGSEPKAPEIDSLPHWQRVMQGHAAANMCVVAASNRIGAETEGDGIQFYGGSFITDYTGALSAELHSEAGIAYADVNFDDMRSSRAQWGLFRDRRPETYTSIGSAIPTR